MDETNVEYDRVDIIYDEGHKGTHKKNVYAHLDNLAVLYAILLGLRILVALTFKDPIDSVFKSHLIDPGLEMYKKLLISILVYYLIPTTYYYIYRTKLKSKDPTKTLVPKKYVVANVGILFLTLTVYLFYYVRYSLISLLGAMTNICLCAKMYSYQATLNTEAETRNSDGRESLLKSISLIDVIRFANSPKLVYRINLPFARERIRRLYLLASLGKMIGFYHILFYTVTHYLKFSIEELHQALAKSRNLSLTMEALTKVSVISSAIFLGGYYLFYNIVLRVSSEIALYEEIYEPCGKWWNSTGVTEFWIHWNRPVKEFVDIHIRNKPHDNNQDKISFYVRKPTKGKLLLFIVSGILHEYVMVMAIRKIVGAFFFIISMQYFLTYQEFSLRTSMTRLKIPIVFRDIFNSCLVWYNYFIFGIPLFCYLVYIRWWLPLEN